MRSTIVLVIAFLCTPSVASARAGSGTSVRVLVGGRHETGIGLRATGAEWRLRVRGAAGTAAIQDVTEGFVSKWVLPTTREELVFDQARFIPGHAYRVTLGNQSLLVYLYPPKVARKQRVDFVDGETRGQVTEDGIAIAPKGTL
jgi:hypothetical protein